ncbi:tape measure protein [Mycobacterium phage Gaia]|uniref:Tape measure protein n=1 Tax=Mycobacterium phage Gaia TaxID=1486472 RepID=A0A068F1L4_9CAUD|nr:tail length tape measure protein [Mycobacterium phage Gaia]AID58832.1 tape measure protein [Mycobacterium phage Gaia]AYQ99955.1 tape measure protein [Mycobacterium phage Nebkiss]
MAVEVASGYVSLSVKLDGATKGLDKLFTGAQKNALAAGKKTGEAYTKALEDELKKSSDQVKQLTDKQSKALDKQADATDKVRVAQQKLNEAREKGVKGSRLTELEAKRDAALRKEAAATKELSRETDALTQAQKRQERAQESLNAEMNKPAKKQGRFRSFFAGADKEAESQGVSAGGRFSAGFSRAMKAAGAIAIGGGIAASLNKVVGVGVDFEKTLNTLSGVTGAGADVMQRFRDTAKALGNDVELSNTSAADAASAMTELAKAGFSVDDSISAAKGTLQLAAAAQIDAASAAEIQANAILAFGLNADYAGKAADVLSNAANASSAEITDVAAALQQGGAVSRAFGVSMEDTSAAIGLLANNGIKGSDAGTLLKSALLALTDQSNPAQGAIETLGLTVYDAQGQFVGLQSLFGQLQQASKSLTPEMYQAATTTLFGSDAARLASVAAKDGAQGFDTMRTAIEKQGAAADLAAAQNQGWPGVIERVKNAAETLSISLFETSNPLQALGDGVAKVLDKINSVVSNESFLSTVKSIGSGLVTGISEAINLFVRFKDVLIPLAAALAGYKVTMMALAGAQALQKIVAATRAWVVAQYALNGALLLNPIGLVVAAIAGLVAGIVVLYKNSETFRNIVQGVWNAIKTAIGAVWNWLSQTVVPGLKAAWDAIAAGAVWLWQNALLPAWNGIKAAIGLVWEFVSDIFNNWVRVGKLVGEGAMWLWNNAIVPAWDGIKNAISAAWDFVSPIFDKFKAGWEILKTGFSAGAKAIGDAVRGAFNGLAGIIKAPLKVLGTFLSKIPTSIAGFEIPGADHLNSWGQSLQGLARGGVVRGPGTGTSDDVLAWLSNGEGVVTAKAMRNGGGLLVSALNAGWVPSADYLRGMMLPGYAEGLNPGADWLRSKVMEIWPEITSIGGRRSEDGYGEHSSGNALDIMIPNYSSDEGIALGNSVLSFLQQNGSALDVDGIIWRQTSYGYGGSLTNGKAMSDRGNDTQNHFDHVHVILGKGRGSSAAPTSVPSVSSLSMPSGRSASGGGGIFGGGRSTKGTAKQIREAEDRITDLQDRLDIAEKELAEQEANPKTKETTKERKRDQVAKLKRDLQQAKDDAEVLKGPGDPESSGSGRSSGSDPFSKITDGIAELANLGVEGLKESFLPEGWSDPTQWGLLQAGGGLLKFLGGLSPDPAVQALTGGFGAALTGDAGGVVNAISGALFPQQQEGQYPGPVDLQPGALPGGTANPAGFTPDGQHAGSGATPGPQLPGVTVNAGAADARQVGNIVNDQYQPAVRRQFGTQRI